MALTYRVQSQKDGRSSLLYLTALGEETLSKLNDLSDDQIRNMVIQLPERSKDSMIRGMTAIERALSDISAEQSIQIRSVLKPGDVGMLIHLHGWIYARECGYNHIFEAYVCKTFYDMLIAYNPDKDRFWLAELDGEIIGSIAIIGQNIESVQLRWFMLHPNFRGMGLGKKLFQEVMNYCTEKGYQRIMLETTEDQKTAIGMYERAGFRKISEHENHSWGSRHIEQTYELHLNEKN